MQYNMQDEKVSTVLSLVNQIFGAFQHMLLLTFHSYS